MGTRTYATLKQAADYLGVTDRTVRQMIADGRLTGYRSGNQLVRRSERSRCRDAAFRRWCVMAHQRQRPRSPQPEPPSETTIQYHHLSGDYRHQAPTADERREQQLLNELQELGYGITVPCLECGHPLTSPRSLARHVGPRCAARAQAVTEQ